MPKEPTNEDQKAAAKKVSPYRRGDAPCTLFLCKKILYRKNEDGTLNHEIQTVSNKWWDGTLTCKSGTERPDIWVVKAEVDKGVTSLRETKQIKYMLYSMRDNCKCCGHHMLWSLRMLPSPRTTTLSPKRVHLLLQPQTLWL